MYWVFNYKGLEASRELLENEKVKQMRKPITGIEWQEEYKW